MVLSDNYKFSGHESFPCKSLWLKKGYDYDEDNGDFNDSLAVVNWEWERIWLVLSDSGTRPLG